MIPELRDLAADSWRDRNWDGLLRLMDHLRQDTLWPAFWCALCAVGARHLGREDARALLREAVQGGFVEVPLLRADLLEAFGGDEDWAEMVAAIAANLPPKPFMLTSWPVQEPMWPLKLCQMAAAREARLVCRLPERRTSAWETALATLAWVATRWVHANHRAVGEDAVEILDRVADGGRFACPEYATVLSQALNAHRVPARCVRLILATHHAGTGRAHVVSEAWIDDLGKWVVLDAQNGLYWRDHEGMPLGLTELRAGVRRPDAVCLTRQHSEYRLDAWWDYFGGPCSTAGRLWAPSNLGLMCEGRPLAADAVQPDARGLYPRLDLPSVGLVSTGAGPALHFGCVHPYSVGFRVRTPTQTYLLGKDDPVWPLEQSLVPASHRIEVAVRTDYGPLAEYEVAYQTA